VTNKNLLKNSSKSLAFQVDILYWHNLFNRVMKKKKSIQRWL